MVADANMGIRKNLQKEFREIILRASTAPSGRQFLVPRGRPMVTISARLGLKHDKMIKLDRLMDHDEPRFVFT
jgi:hypothetical protein